METSMLSLQIQPESRIPIYAQLRDQLRALVRIGQLAPGDRIPPSRELAARLGVHRTTVANAYAELESEGLIRGHVGRGTFICGQPNGPNGSNGTSVGHASSPPPASPAVIAEKTNGAVRWDGLFAEERAEESLDRLLPTSVRNAISFTIARPPENLFPLDDFRRCCNTVLRHRGREILQQGQTDGYPALREALGGWLREEGIGGPQDRILITDGCQQGLDLLARVFLRPGDTVLLENPTYPGAIAAFSSRHVRAIGVSVRPGAGVDLEAIGYALERNRVKLIVLMPDFQNPTGTTLSLADRRRVLELAERYRVPIVEDHIYARLRTTGQPVPSLKALDRAGIVIQIDSLSKLAFPGLRVGWCVAPEPVIDRLRLAKQAADLHTCQLAQASAAEFIRRGLLAKHLERMRKVYRSRLEATIEALERWMPEEVHWSEPEGGMCVWVTLPPGLDAVELLVRARERGVMFAPGRLFFLDHAQPNTLRLGFSELNERRIARGIRVLGELATEQCRRSRRGRSSQSDNLRAVTLV
jgi:2-aminoadipate transaminase